MHAVFFIKKVMVLKSRSDVCVDRKLKTSFVAQNICMCFFLSGSIFITHTYGTANNIKVYVSCAWGLFCINVKFTFTIKLIWVVHFQFLALTIKQVIHFSHSYIQSSANCNVQIASWIKLNVWWPLILKCHLIISTFVAVLCSWRYCPLWDSR